MVIQICDNQRSSTYIRMSKFVQQWMWELGFYDWAKAKLSPLSAVSIFQHCLSVQFIFSLSICLSVYLSIFSSFKLSSAWKFNNVEKSPSCWSQNSTSNSGPLGPVLPGAILPAVTFWLLGSRAAVHVHSSRGLGTVEQVCCGSQLGFCQAVWELACDWWILASLVCLSVCICTHVWIFAYMHAFENLRMPCVNWPTYLYENGVLTSGRVAMMMSPF
jgi:hypothetical protein